jgi:hypothetical protein
MKSKIKKQIESYKLLIDMKEGNIEVLQNQILNLRIKINKLKEVKNGRKRSF